MNEIQWTNLSIKTSNDTVNIYPYREQQFVDLPNKLVKELKSEANRKYLTRFRYYLINKNCSKIRITKVETIIRKILQRIDKDIDKLNRSDFEQIVFEIKTNPKYKEWTKNDYLKTLKRFIFWISDEYPETAFKDEIKGIIKFFKALNIGSVKNQIDPSSIITETDLAKLLDACENHRDKALLSLLHETGGRIGEILNLKIKDLQFKENVALIYLNGKTGRRNPPIIKSIPYLVQYLSVHPKPKDPEAPLFISFNGTKKGNRLNYEGCRKRIIEIFARSGIQKKCNPHFFRHSRASLFANKLTEQSLNSYMGWTQGSRQTRTYVHMATEQLENQILEINGINKKENQVQPTIQTCICGTINNSDAVYCFKCGKPLSLKTAIKDQDDFNDQLEKSIEFMQKVFSDPHLFERYKLFEQRLTSIPKEK